MNENELRIEAEKRNRVVTDEGWNELHERGYVQDALGKDFDEDKIAEIIKAIDHERDKYWPAARVASANSSSAGDGSRSDSSVRPGPFAVDLADTERERALLFMEAQARAATTDPHVQGFRKRYLSDGLLVPDDAEQVLEAGPPVLKSVGTYLHEYYGWHEGEARWWVLTGKTPSARPVRVSYKAAETLDAPGVYQITIEAPPWISPATFQGAFAEMRRRMHAERRLPDARSVRVVRFVKRLRSAPDAKRPTFEQMYRRWNDENPDAAFSEPRTFERTYQRNANILDRQYNTEIEREETPELKRQRARTHKKTERIRERDRAAYDEAIEAS